MVLMVGSKRALDKFYCICSHAKVEDFIYYDTSNIEIRTLVMSHKVSIFEEQVAMCKTWYCYLVWSLLLGYGYCSPVGKLSKMSPGLLRHCMGANLEDTID